MLALPASHQRGLCYVPASSSIIQHTMIYSVFLLLCCFCTSVVVGTRGCQPRSVGHPGWGMEGARLVPAHARSQGW